MTELSGMLDGLGLPAIVRFLSGLNKSGLLQLSQKDWHGEIYFDSGRVTHATFGNRTGLMALDALVEVLQGAGFTFDSHTEPAAEPTIQLSHDELLAHLEEVSAQVASGERGLPAADAVPVQTTLDGGAEEPLQLDRSALQTLMAVDGRRSVREIVARRGSFDALWHLASLIRMGLIQLEPAAPDVEPADVVENPTPEPDAVQAADPNPPATVHCPKLGFEDDPASSFGRPTRLHRCFAVGRPLPLSLDQQRELCLGEEFASCPRLSSQANGTGRPPRPAPEPEHPEPGPVDEPRIVRLPLSGRTAPSDREVASGSALEPRPLRPFGPAHEQDGFRSPVPPTPLRARLNRVASAAVATTTVASAAETAPGPATDQAAVVRSPREPGRLAIDDKPPTFADTPLLERRLGPVPLMALAVVGIVLVAAVAFVIMLLPQVDSLFSDNTLDPSTLPNASLVEAGTPVASLGLNRATPVPAQSTDVAVDGVQATAEPAAATAQPTTPNTVEATATAAQASAPLLDERFTSNDAGWPSNPIGAALITNGTYRITTRQAGQFAAVSAPLANIPGDVVVGATFRKLAGPPGGGYGIIVRDQAQTLRDGSSQDGQYYVLEVGDKGDVGIWRRDADHWVDLLPWQHSDAVRTDEGINELTVRAIGNTLSLNVNGTDVATRSDATFAGGRAGLFVGGDGNQVAISRFTVQAP
jgi:hypothetical protein